MATYKTDIYGLRKYGPSQQAEFSTGSGTDGFYSLPTAGGTEPGSVAIYWNPVGGTFVEFRLVRNFLNSPSNEEDGDIVSTSNSGEFIDTGLPQGSFVYYSIFVQTLSGEWFSAGDLIVLITRDWGYGDRLWELLPQFYRDRDEALISPNDPEPLRRDPEGPLRRYLRVVGHELDVVRTEYETMRLLADPGYIAGGLLPVLAAGMGLDFEAELGMRRNRSYIENAIHFYKLKGTKPGIEGIVTAVTGWDDSVSIGVNLLLDTRDSTFQLGVIGALTAPYGTWAVTGGTGVITLTDENTEGFTSAISNFDLQFLKIVGQGTIGTLGTLQGGLIPVGGLTDIVFSIYARSDASGSGGSVGLAFYDKHRVIIGTASTTGFSSTNASWSRPFHTAAVPAGAFFMRPIYTYEDYTARTHFIDFAQVESGTTPTTYENPRTIHISLHPDRINLVQNPSIEADLFGWSALTNSTLARVTAAAKYGIASGRAQSVAAGTMSWGTAIMPVTPGRRYAGSVHMQPVVTPQLVSCSIVWLNGIGSILSVVQSPDEQEVLGEWVRPGVVGIAPSTATHAYLLCQTASTSAAGEQHYWDAALFEQAESVKAYFDASFASSTSDYLWENFGTAHTAPSYQYSKRTVKRARLLQVLEDYLPAAASSTLEFAKNP